MSLDRRRVRAISRKEVREYRRNRSLVTGMAIIPLLFLVQPLVSVFAVPASGAVELSHRHVLLYLLGIPALVPATLAAYAVVGERLQGTLEPLLGTPIRRDELLLGKALAVLLPSIAISYAVYAVFLALVTLLAHPGVAAALIRGSDVLAQVLFTPLIAGWSIWAAVAISTRAGEVRVAQQLATLVSLPSIAVTTLIAVDVIHATIGLALVLAAVLLAANVLGWRLVTTLFDRERLITGVGS
jgi:ABC-2 type transport system permease protein